MSLMFFASSFIFYKLDRKLGVMSTEKEDRLHKRITIPETEIPLPLLFDLIEFAANRRDEFVLYDRLSNIKYDDIVH